MIQIGCKTHPRYEAKSKRTPRCATCHDLWSLKHGPRNQPPGTYTLVVRMFVDELKVSP